MSYICIYNNNISNFSVRNVSFGYSLKTPIHNQLNYFMLLTCYFELLNIAAIGLLPLT